LGPLATALDPGRSPDIAIDAQLTKIGVKPSDINYVILGHMHLDHAGNLGKFPTATAVYQRDEIVNAFWPKPGFGGPYITGDFAMLRNDVGQNQVSRQKVIELNSDLDLFGDGSIYIHRAVSHTPGSQMVVVRLPKTGPVVLTSDVCLLMENLQKDILPSIALAYDPAGMLDAYSWIKHMTSAEGADVIFAHDAEIFKKHKQSPEFYE
jgi:N-acyl homoserine lactone hydrolase